jgi:eukaryotic-like serine/threonine-protein kinase
MSTIEPDRIWDLWAEALEKDHELTPAGFAEQFGDQAREVLATLKIALDVQDQAPPPSLVNLLTGEPAEDGTPRFAGFRLEEELGHGASGLVFRATDLRTGRPEAEVALKILNPLLAASPDRRDLILREAEIAGQLDHPGIVSILDSGAERGYAWIAAEYVEGGPLDEVIDERLSQQERERIAIDLALQMCSALAHAHGLGVIHRDLKPANLLVDEEGRVRIVDFGLARSEGTAFALSSTGDSVGTPL